jgi:peptidyl-Lys metalloendopeptidase
MTSDLQAGTIIHELSHFNVNGKTVDAGYGTSGCKDLAVAKANVATSNADSHQYFSENNPFLD